MLILSTSLSCQAARSDSNLSHPEAPASGFYFNFSNFRPLVVQEANPSPILEQ